MSRLMARLAVVAALATVGLGLIPSGLSAAGSAAQAASPPPARAVVSPRFRTP